MNKLTTYSKDLTFTKTDTGSDGILASVLYKNLGGNSKDFQRWAKRNITENYILIYGTDYIILKNPQKSQNLPSADIEKSAISKKSITDYILSLPVAQKLSLSIKTPKQQEVISKITDYIAKTTKEPMIPASKVADMVSELVRKTLAEQNAGLKNYESLQIESDKKDRVIESLQLDKKIKHNNLQTQATIRQIVNIIARETPFYAERKDAHQVIYNIIISDFFKMHPIHWKSEWYALKDKGYAKTEFERIKEKTTEKPVSKLDWIRLEHPDALLEIMESARNVAIKNLPYDYFQRGGTLPA
jgi:hypothetical protein